MEDANDIGTIINCTFKGIELAGTFGEKGIKAVVKIFLFLHAWEERKRLTKTGKISAKTMKEKYGDAVIYKNMRIVAEEVRKNEAGNPELPLSEQSLKKVKPSAHAQTEHWKKLAKKQGLNYVMFPNPEGGYILQVPKEQEAIYEEVCKQHFAWIKKETMKYCREVAQDKETAWERPDVRMTADQVYESMTPQSKEVISNPYPALSRDEVLEIIANLEDEKFNTCMKEAFPGYNAEDKSFEEIMEEIKGDKNIPEEKKKEIFRALADYDQKRAREKGLVKEFAVDKRNMTIRQEEGKTFITFVHPQHPNTLVTVDAQNLCGRMKWNGSRAGFCLYKDCEVTAVTKKIVVSNDSRKIKKSEYKGSVADLEGQIKTDAQKAEKKYQRARAAGKNTARHAPKPKLG